LSDRLPSFDAAWAEARSGGVRRSWAHAAVYLAAKSMGFAKLGERDRADFREVYVRLCNRVVAGEVLSCPAIIRKPALAVPSVSSPSVARPVASASDALREIRARLS